MPKIFNIIGQKFNLLTVVKISVKDDRKQQLWICRCDCGNLSEVSTSNLRGGRVKSCGCVGKEKARELLITMNTRHGLCSHPLHFTWNNMKQRCFNKKHPSFPRYGARGITVCDKWLEFINFFEDMHVEYDKHAKNNGRGNTSLDRIDNDGSYCPENCRFTTRKNQQNNRSNNEKYACSGEFLTLTQWSENSGVPYERLRGRVVKCKWDLEKALNTTAGKYTRR